MEEPTSAPRPTPGNTPGSASGNAPDPTLAYEPPAYGPAQSSVPPAAGYGHPSPYTGPAMPGSPFTGSPASRAPFAPAPGVLTNEERNWATVAHLSGFVAAYLALGFLGPLAVMLTAGRRSPFVRRHAVEALNFNLTVLLALFVSAILMIVLVGFLMLALVGIGYVVLTIAGAMAASRGADYRYPLTIRFFS